MDYTKVYYNPLFAPSSHIVEETQTNYMQKYYNPLFVSRFSNNKIVSILPPPPPKGWSGVAHLNPIYPHSRYISVLEQDDNSVQSKYFPKFKLESWADMMEEEETLTN
jgi:hypothetical protein